MTTRVVSEDEIQWALERAIRLMKSVGNLSDSLAVVQASCLMACQGTIRATVSEVTERTLAQYGREVTPPVAGQIFSLLKIRRVTSHGRNKLVLDAEQLKGHQKSLEAQIDEAAPLAEEIVAIFGDVIDRVMELEGRLELYYEMMRREREIREYLKTHSRYRGRLGALERQYKDASDQAKRSEHLGKSIEALEENLKDLPALEAKKRAIEVRAEAYESQLVSLGTKERDLEERRAALGSRVSKLDRQFATVKLAELEEELAERKRRFSEGARNKKQRLDEEIRQKKQALDQEVQERRRVLKDLDKQINWSRSRLSRIFGKTEETGP